MRRCSFSNAGLTAWCITAVLLTCGGAAVAAGDLEQKLAASDGSGGDRLGASVAVDLDTAVVGASAESSDRGAAYVYVRNGGMFVEQAKLTAADGVPGDAFGYSVAVDGHTIVVGARYDDDSGTDSGAAYVFTRDASGNWSQQEKLTANDASTGDLFGRSVAIERDTVVVGAPLDDEGATGTGSIYVFTRDAGVWTERQKLTTSDASWEDAFGWSVEIHGDTIAAGAPLDDVAAVDCGSAYVFVLSGGVWTEQDKLVAAVSGYDAYFGARIGLHGDTVVAGAYGEDDAGFVSGAAYVFARAGDDWTQQAKLRASDAASGDFFGWSVAVSGETIMVGADGDGADSGAAYRFTPEPPSGDWVEREKLRASDARSGDEFGRSIAIDRNTVLVGAWGVDADAGAAYTFRLPTKLTASDAEAQDWFGDPVAVDGDTAVVGAHGDDDHGEDSGAAYVFVRADGVWTEQQKLTASDGTSGKYFGRRVAVSGDTAVIESTNPVSTYVFVRSEGVWTEEEKRTGVGGSVVATSGDTMVIGSKDDDDFRGSADVFVRTGEAWTLQQRLLASDGAAHDDFGTSVAVNADTVVVGAFGDDSNRGAAYVFVRSDGVWTEQQKLIVSDGAPGDFFGRAVAVSREVAVIGAGYWVSNGTSAYVFTRTAGAWTEQEKLSATGVAAGDKFGWSVAVSRETVVVGSYGDDDHGIGSGSAYVFVDGPWPLEFQIHPPPIRSSTAGTPFDAQLETLGGSRPVRWDTSPGTLPVSGGIDADTGEIDGTWGPPGVHSFTIRARDAAGHSTTRDFTVTVSEWPEITTTELPFAVLGRPLRTALRLSGGTAEFTWALRSGALPAGLIMNSATGEILGLPRAVGLSEFVVGCTDLAGAVDEQELTLDVVPVLDLRKKKHAEAVPFDPGNALVPLCRAVELVAGTRLDVVAKRPAKDAPLELVVLSGLQRELDISAALKSKRKTLVLKRFVVPATDRYFIVLTALDPLAGTGKLTVKVTPPTKAAGELTLDGQQAQEVTFATLPGARVSLVVKASKKSAAVPTILGVADDEGNDLLVPDELRLKSKSAVLKMKTLAPGGTLTVRIGTRDGTTGAVKWTAKIKEPSGYRYSDPDLPVGGEQ